MFGEAIMRRCLLGTLALVMLSGTPAQSGSQVTPNGFRLVELSPGIDFNFVQERTGAPLFRTPEPIEAG